MEEQTNGRSKGAVVRRGPMDARLEAELAAVAQSACCELLHVEWKGGVLRLVLDRPEGVSLADCEVVAKQVSALLDVEDFGHHRYVLEVSSPGLDRELYRLEDYERFRGRQVRVTFLDPQDQAKKTVSGRLAAFERRGGEPEAEIRLVATQAGREYTIPLRNIQLARLEIEL